MKEAHACLAIVLRYIELLTLLLGFARNLDSAFIKKFFFLSFLCENGHIRLD